MRTVRFRAGNDIADAELRLDPGNNDLSEICGTIDHLQFHGLGGSIVAAHADSQNRIIRIHTEYMAKETIALGDQVFAV